jgi:hypothetical protein
MACVRYASLEHERAAERIVGFFSRDSCLDIAVLVPVEGSAEADAARRASCTTRSVCRARQERTSG